MEVDGGRGIFFISRYLGGGGGWAAAVDSQWNQTCTWLQSVCLQSGFSAQAGTARLSAADRRRARIPVSWCFVSGVGPGIPSHYKTPASRPKLAVCMHEARPPPMHK